MGHSSSTNYTISSSVTTEQNGDSIVNGLLPSNVTLTIAPNAGFAVASENFTISNFTPTSTTTVGSGATQYVSYFYHSVSSSLLPSGTTGINTLPAEVDYVVLVNTVAGSPTGDPINNILVYVYFVNGFVMPSYNLTLNIDIDGKPAAANNIQHPILLTTFIGPIYSSISALSTAPSSWTDGTVTTSSNSQFLENQANGLVDAGVSTHIMSTVFTATNNFYIDSINETEWLTSYGLADWLPYFDIQQTAEVFNNSGQLTSRTYEYYYTSPDPITSGLDPALGASLGFFYDYNVIAFEETSQDGVAPLNVGFPRNNETISTSSEELGNAVVATPKVTSKRQTTFFKSISSVVFNKSVALNAVGGDERTISVFGDEGASYVISIKNDDSTFLTYDESSDTFTSSTTQINAEIGSSGNKTHVIVFPQASTKKIYSLTISSTLGTKLPENIENGEIGNIAIMTSNINRTFTLEFSNEFIDATCDYNNDPTIAHNDDNGKIQVGMAVTGTGIPSGATVVTRTSDTAFELSASTTTGNVVNGTLAFNATTQSPPADIVYNFTELTNQNYRNEFEVTVDGDEGEVFTAVSALAENPSGLAFAAMAVASGDATGWEFSMTGFAIRAHEVDAKTNKDRITVKGTIIVTTVGAASVKYKLRLGELTNIS